MKNTKKVMGLLKEHFGVENATFKRVEGYGRSINYQVDTAQGEKFVYKQYKTESGLYELLDAENQVLQQLSHKSPNFAGGQGEAVTTKGAPNRHPPSAQNLLRRGGGGLKFNPKPHTQDYYTPSAREKLLNYAESTGTSTRFACSANVGVV